MNSSGKVALHIECSTKEHYLALCLNIYEWCKQYLAESPVVSDETYDVLKTRLAEIERDHPEWVVDWSPNGKALCGIPEGNKPNSNEEFRNVNVLKEFSVNGN